MKTESENPFNTQQFTNKVYHDLSKMRIKDKGKFKQRMGPEFENWIAGLVSNGIGSDLINAVVGDDEFWNLTLKLTLGI